MDEMFKVAKTYQKYFDTRPITIVEIGSRDGHDAFKLFKMLEPESVYTFDANPLCYQIIQKNYPEFTNVYGAVSNYTGRAQFNAVQSMNWDAVGTSSLRDRSDDWYDGKISKVEVAVDTMQNYIESYQIPLPLSVVKIDVEGCSYEVLEGFGEHLSSIKVLHVENETYPFWQGQKLDADVSEFLQSHGFVLESSSKFGEHSIDRIWVNAS